MYFDCGSLKVWVRGVGNASTSERVRKVKEIVDVDTWMDEWEKANRRVRERWKGVREGVEIGWGGGCECKGCERFR